MAREKLIEEERTMPNDLIFAELEALADTIRDTEYLALYIDADGDVAITNRRPKTTGTTCLCYYNEGDCPVCDL
jgi:hypothetical protein